MSELSTAELPPSPENQSRRNLLKLSLAHTSTAIVTTAWTLIAQDSTTKNYTLDVREFNGSPSYKGKITGSTITINPGENIDVHLINSLPALHDDCVSDVNNFHGLNTTNHEQRVGNDFSYFRTDIPDLEMLQTVEVV